MADNSITRRAWLAAASASLLAEEGDEAVPFADYTSRFKIEAQERNPRVRNFDLRKLSSWQTPASEFFSFHQTSTPPTSASDWKLKVGGAVERPHVYTLEELERRFKPIEVAATIECAGNSRQPELMNGLVGNAVWGGISLAEVLRQAGVRPEAREVALFGADTEKETKWQAGNREMESAHGRSLFVQDAVAPGPLLAMRMNGAAFAPERGFPLRLVVPGWYGMAHIKWLTRIEVLDRRYEGRQMARNYHSLRALENGFWLDTSISKMRVKSVVAQVWRRKEAGQWRYRIGGAAWGGAIARVEVAVDGNWREARMDHAGTDSAWWLWSCAWPEAKAGRHEIVSRAVTRAGEVQPTQEELKARLASFREDHAQWVRTVIVG